ncbi:MAG: GspE/PulE family protein [Planctomycetota bacterium]|nr:MAG: GspE/PulE family protein [Planctomycetota bacterium]
MGKDTSDIGGALDWLNAAADDEDLADDGDWLGLGETLSVDAADLGDRYMVEATLRKLTTKIHSCSLDEIFLSLKDDLQVLLGADRVTIYDVDKLRKQIVSKIRDEKGEVVELRLPIGTQSLAGYVAATGRIVSVADAYDDEEVKRVHSLLSFDVSWDQKTGYRTRQVLAVPVKVGRKVEGVIQLVNREEPGPFTGRHKRILMEIAETLAVAFTNQRRLRARRSKFDRLYEMYLVDEEMVDEASVYAQREGMSVEHALSEKFSVPKKEILASLADYYRVEPIEFKDDAVPPTSDVLELFAVEFLKHHGCCPVGFEDGELVFALANPKDVPLRDSIKQRLERGRRFKVKVAVLEDIHAFVEKFYPQTQDEPSAVTAEALTDLVSQIDFDAGPMEERKVVEEPVEEVEENNTGIMRLVNTIIEHAYHRGVSDIHIEPYPDDDIVVRYRIDGVCQTYTKLPRKFARAIISRIKIMSDLDIAEKRLPQDGKIKFKKYSNLDIELRVATLPTVGGMEDCVMRILAASKPLPLDAMGFLPENLAAFQEVVSQPYGLVLVVGPTGSGKTTTLHSALGYINKPETKIWTAEDPVEITQAGLRQLQVLPKIGLDFARALRAFLRADPDVIMIGEMRDQETAEAGVEASLTGHLVFSTLHTNSAPETVTRLLDLGLDPYSFGDSLLGVLAQRLVRRLCKECKQPIADPDEELAELRSEYGYDAGWERLGLGAEHTLQRRVGCDKCGEKGYRGRMGIHEFMKATDGLRQLIYRHAKVAEIRDLALEEGMTTLKQDGIRKVLSGHTDIHEVRRVCIK